ncbi:hypothetical protein B0H11DRAFT_2346274 [Mycena galericulata]|nr:hypothetical protein B0H11DRAFT_2346274 [Mycena galericulata]
MPERRSSRRHNLAARSGLGAQSHSPTKQRDPQNKKRVGGIGRDIKRRTLAARLTALLDAADASHTDDRQPGSSHDGVEMDPSGDIDMEDTWIDEPPPLPPPAAPAAQRVVVVHHDNKHASTVGAWNSLLPLLERPFLQYRRDTQASVPPIIPDAVAHACGDACAGPNSMLVQCLYPTHVKMPRTAVSIDLLDLYRGFFERSCDAITALAAALHTTYTRRGFAVDSLRTQGMRATDPFRRALSNAVLWSSNLQTRLDARVSAALADAASVLGYQSTAASQVPHPVPGSPPGEAPAQGAADVLDDTAEDAVDHAADDVIDDTMHSDAASSPLPPPPPGASSPPPTPSASDSPPPTREQAAPPLTPPGRADRILRERCPACFGLETWGRPLQEGGDVQLGGDGCFSYRHLRSAGDGPISYTPDYFIPKAKMDAVNARIAAARKRPAARCTPTMPQEALDACESSWEAANEKKRKADPQRYDASGVFALTCRHSQVLFLCNIDTPGEQQQYIIAALEVVQEHLPPQATILQTYDVGCLTDNSCNLVSNCILPVFSPVLFVSTAAIRRHNRLGLTKGPIEVPPMLVDASSCFPLLTPGLRERVSFAINAMHAYGHQWVCQLIYNPRMRRGCGLTDGEGVEHIWSRIRKLIPLTRNQWNSRRIWMIDLYMSFINAEGLTNLGGWLQRQQEKNLAPKLASARRTLRDCRVPASELRSEWAAQKTAQSSVRAHAPARLKRELDKVLALQVQIDTVETSILEVKTSIAGDGSAAAETHIILRRLQETHQALSDQAEALYASLNIAGTFPELDGLPLEFVRTLLLMRDLKINLRKRAVGSFYEWETLDRAVSGRREALGTKLHQATRKAITRRQPALVRAIRKFNAYCAQLEALRPPGCPIPIPAALPTTLDALRSDPALHEDVWIQSASEPIPRWLEDHDVRDGIRSLHTIDRCVEEADRLNEERMSLRRWLGEELAVVAMAIAANDPDLHLPLVRRQQDLQYLSRLWEPALRLRPRPQGAPTAITDVAPVPAASPERSLAHSSPSASAAPRPEDDEDFFEGPHTGDDNDIVASEELDPELISDTDEPLLVADLLETPHELEETSGVEAITWELQWETPALVADPYILQELDARTRHVQIVRDRRRRQGPPTPSGSRGNTIDIADLDTLTTSRGRLNGFCLNGVAATLHAHFSQASCAVLSTYDLGRIRYNASDDEVWRHVGPTLYWEKSMWLLPIHRPQEEHWVLAVIPVHQRRVFLFDSLASRGGWRRDLKDIMTLITRMVSLAERKHHPMSVGLADGGAWGASHLFEPGRPRQTNSYDCGVWVLCTMAAFMRGYCSTGVSEKDMGHVRRLLTDLVLALPPR